MKNVIIATPSYKNTVTVPYMQSMIDYHFSQKFRVAYNIYPGDSLVCRARNGLFTNIMDNMPNFEYMIWQDDDVSATKEGVERIIDLKLDAISLVTPLRVQTTPYGLLSAVIEVYEEVEKFLYKAEFAGFGVFALSKKACIDIINYCEENSYWYVENGRKVYDVFRVGVTNNNFYQSEDFYVCSILKEMGYEIYVDSSTPISHGPVYRARCEINPESIGQKYSKELEHSDAINFWTPNDFGNYKSLTV